MKAAPVSKGGEFYVAIPWAQASFFHPGGWKRNSVVTCVLMVHFVKERKQVKMRQYLGLTEGSSVAEV